MDENSVSVSAMPYESCEEALKNYLILLNIFDHLSLYDLKNFRLVNKSWEEASTSTIIHRRLWKLTINSKFRKQHRKYSFCDLNNCIESSREFPLTSLEFSSNNWHLTRSKYTDFFNMTRSSIRRLTLYNSRMSLQVLQTLIFECLPNLEYLDLDYIGVNCESLSDETALSHTNNHLRLLPKLKIVRFHCIQLDIVKYVLRAAINLEKIEEVEADRSILEIIIETDRVNAIKELFFLASHHTSEEMASGFYGRLAQVPIQLDALCLMQNPIEQLKAPCPYVTTCLANIIESSKNSLRKICCPSFLYLMGVQAPVFTKLKCLQLTDRGTPTRENDLMYPNFSNPKVTCPMNIIPSVDTIIFKQNQLNVRCWKKYFPIDDVDSETGSVEIIPTVKNIEICGSFDKFSVTAIGKKFPYLTFIKLTRFGEFPLNSLIWNVPPSVLSLELCKLECKDGIADSFDSFITGIPEQVCKNLKRKGLRIQGQDEITAGDLNLWKVQPSVCDLQNLKWLKFVFNHKSNSKWVIPLGKGVPNSDTTCVISKLSGLLGLGLVPNLQVFFAFDHSRQNYKDIATALKPVEQFVTFIHESCLESSEVDFGIV